MTFSVESTCAGCDQTTKSHKWGKVKAQERGWFFQKDGTVYCPDHIPAWVEAWRKQNTT